MNSKIIQFRRHPDTLYMRYNIFIIRCVPPQEAIQRPSNHLLSARGSLADRPRTGDCNQLYCTCPYSEMWRTCLGPTYGDPTGGKICIVGIAQAAAFPMVAYLYAPIHISMTFRCPSSCAPRTCALPRPAMAGGKPSQTSRL
jgi:hypothetical protein